MEVDERKNNGGSEQGSSSDDGQFLVALRKMMKKEVEVVVIRTVEQMIVPVIGDLLRKVVKEEIQSVEKRLLARNENEVERCLQLKLPDEVCDPVLTGKPLNAKGGNSLKVELVDRATGRVVENGPISYAKVEILVLDASHDDSEHNWTLENFNSKIIREGDKKRPHFTKNIFIDLKEGVGILSNVKLGHDSSWMKSCKCRLGARIVDGFRGVYVQEGRTGSFNVVDCRSRQYKKHYPPSLSDKVWRLDYIGRDGPPCKRLNQENIETVEDFLFMLSVNPRRLQELVGASAKWKATVDHARTCPKDDKVYLYYTSTESKMGVIFDAVGGLKGIINDSHYVPINDLSADEKGSARELLLSAFKNREARTSFDDEASLLKQFPYISSDINSPTNSSIQEGLNGNYLSVSEYIDEHYPVEPGISSQSNGAYITTLDCPNNLDHFGFLASTDTGQICSPVMDVPMQFPSCPFPDPGTSSQSTISALGNPNNMFHLGSLESPTMGQLHELHSSVQIPSYFESLTDNWSLMSLINSGSNNQILRAEPPSRQQSNARAYRLVFPMARAKLWVIRAKKRVMTLGGNHAHKKQKT
ncbi:hypothetical protein ACS0TY_035533 [Phlomoides rotata]